jgi:hypothetical protein
MPDYSNSKIYAIRSHQTENVYIGSTAQTLSQRFSGHRRSYKKFLNNEYCYMTSFEILQYDDAYIELIEAFSCNIVEELRKKEGEYIRKMDCVNKCIAGRTSKQWRKDNVEIIAEKKKKYNEKNKEKIAENAKKYQEEHKEEIKEKNKEYYEKNKEKRLEQAKEYNEANKEKITERKKEKYTCVCGKTGLKCSKARHEKTKKHIKWVEENK